MAKVRVYELAKELNIESKKLVESLVSAGMDINNYMSTLDEEAAARAKEIISGAESQIIEEKRIKPSVIRRRKKKIEQEIPAVSVAEEEKPEGVELGQPSEEAKIPGETEERVEIAKEEKIPAEVPEEAPAGPVVDKAAKPVTEAKSKPRKARKKKADQPARIIKRPEEGPLGDILADRAEKMAAEPVVQKVTPLVPSEAEGVKAEEPGKKRPSKWKKGKKGKEKEERKDIDKDAVRHRKREVYERADLYQTRPGRPKARKGAQKGKQDTRKARHTEITVPKAIKRKIKVQESVTVAELAKAMGIKAKDLVKKLMGLGFVASINESIDFDTASVAADEWGYELELDTFLDERLTVESEDRPEDLVPRPPVVTIMGHVDHGKTSLLDYIRKSNIIGGESGGITQHIGAYYVETEGGDIVFLDTPGHEAFTAMRARGAKITDLIVLVVAADDGAMPQTREAINHARAANIPIVVAVNKIDKPEADPDKVKRELAELDLAPEDWGGETIFGNVSAKTGEGVDELLNLILLQSEILELTGNPKKQARGTIVEAKLDKSKGPVATVLIKQGTLKQGDHFVCGEHYGRVRAMLNCLTKRIESAGPSVPVEVYGISGVPMAGDEFIVVEDEKTAKQVVEFRKMRGRKPEMARGSVSLDDLFERMKQGEMKGVNVVLKTDVQGSLEALADSLVKQSTEEVKLQIIHSGTGAITESDVMLASASGAIIIGFNVRVNPRVSMIAEKENVDIRYYDVIYNVIKDIRLAMTGLLEPIYKEHVIGRVDIKEIFRVPKVGVVAGCHVSDGHIERNSNVRLLRDEVVVFDGKVASLRRFKEDVKEVQSGYECGIGLENFNDIKPGDVFEIYRIEELEAEL